MFSGNNYLSRKIIKYSILLLLFLLNFSLMTTANNNPVKFLNNNEIDQNQRSQLIESKIEQFHSNALNNVDLFNKVEYPKSFWQKTAENGENFIDGATFGLALSADVALVVSLGSSEAVSQTVSSLMKFKSLPSYLKKMHKGAKLFKTIIKQPNKIKTASNIASGISIASNVTFSTIKHDDLIDVATSGVKQAVGSSVPIIRTFMAFDSLKINQLKENYNKMVSSLVALHYKILSPKLLLTYQQLEATIQSAQIGANVKTEYLAVINKMFERYVDVLTYQSMYSNVANFEASQFLRDYQIFLAQHSSQRGQGTNPRTYFINDALGIGRSVHDYVYTNVSESGFKKIIYAESQNVLPKYSDVEDFTDLFVKQYLSALTKQKSIIKQNYNKYFLNKATSYLTSCIKYAPLQNVLTNIGVTQGQTTVVPDFVSSTPLTISDNFPINNNSYHRCGFPPEKANYQPIKDKKPITIIAIVDSSGSMKKTDPKNLRIDALEMIAHTLGRNVFLAIIDFDNNTQVISPLKRLGEWGSSNRNQLINSLKKIDSSGGTNTLPALEKAKQLASSDTVFLLLGDGQDPKFKKAVNLQQINISNKVHTIALSSNADTQTLSRLASLTGGEYEFADNASELARVINNLFNKAESSEQIYISQQIIKQDQVKDLSFFIEANMRQFTGSLSWQGSDIDLTLISPSGRLFTIDQAVALNKGVEAKTYDLIRIENPEVGHWIARLTGIDLPSPELSTFNVSSSGTINQTRWNTNVTVPEKKQAFTISIQSEQAIDWQQVKGKLYRPDGSLIKINEQPKYKSDIFSNNEEQAIWSIQPEKTGLYKLELTVIGTTGSGDKIQRSFSKSLQVESMGKGVKKHTKLKPLIPRNRH